MAQGTYQSETLRVVDLPVSAEPNVVRGLTFIDCLMMGPAVIAPMDGTRFLDCVFPGISGSDLIWPISLERTNAPGAIPMYDCLFVRCRIRRVGIALSEPRVAEFLAGYEDPPLTRFLPAICTTCGSQFDSGFPVSVGMKMVAVRNTSGPCPRCGGTGQVPDGVYELVEAVQEAAASAPLSELEEIEQAAQDAADGNETADELADRIERVGSRWSMVAAWVRRNAPNLINGANVILNLLRLTTGH